MTLKQFTLDTYEQFKGQEKDIIDHVRASPRYKLHGFWRYYYNHLWEYDPDKAERIIKADDKLAVRLELIPCTIDEMLDDERDAWEDARYAWDDDNYSLWGGR